MSVIEFKHPVMVLPFNNCELHCCSMDGYKGNSEALLSRLNAIDDYFASKSKAQQKVIIGVVGHCDIRRPNTNEGKTHENTSLSKG